MEETFIHKFSPHSIFKFIFLSLCVYIFKKCPSQFFQCFPVRNSVFSVFPSEELSCLPYKNRNKSLTLSYLVENSNLLYTVFP
jgi:hypothetical protein